MKSKLAFAPLVSLAQRPCRRRPSVHAVLICLLTLSALPAAVTAQALEGDGLKQNMPVQELPVQDVQQPKLRSILISSHDSADEPVERRRLNAEERTALHRDLRDAMRGAYPDQPSARTKQR